MARIHTGQLVFLVAVGTCDLDQTLKHVLDVGRVGMILMLMKLHEGHVFDAKFQVVQFGQEMDHLLVCQHVLLKLFDCLSDLNVVHVKSLILLMVVFLLLKGLHELILFAKEHLLSNLLDLLGVDLLREDQNVVERSHRQLGDLELELLNGFIQILVSVTDFSQTGKTQRLDNRFGGESENDLG